LRGTGEESVDFLISVRQVFGSMPSKRLGRPPEFQQPVRFLVTLEVAEYRRLQAASRAERISASAWVRRCLLAALTRQRRKEAR
jgi:hypothetical protein